MNTVADFEDEVWSKEGVRIVIRANPNDPMPSYDYTRKAAGNASLSDWLNNRIKPLPDGKDYYVMDGTGTRPHGRTKMDKIRDSYDSEE